MSIRYSLSFVFALFLFQITNAQTYEYSSGIGVRLGDPSGISFKKYSGDRAFELNIGRTHYFVNSRSFDRKYSRWYNEWDLGNFNNYWDYDYLDVRYRRPIGFQMHYLIHNDLMALDLPTLQWYFGAGPQARWQAYRHDYRYKLESGSGWIYETERYVDLDVGLDAVLGMEMMIPNSSLMLFADVNVFIEIVDDPFLGFFQSGIGVRYIF